jgi:hypothetical protein
MRKVFVVDWDGGEISSHLISSSIHDYFRKTQIPNYQLSVQDVTCQATLDMIDLVLSKDMLPKERMANYFAPEGSGGVISKANSTEKNQKRG